MTPYFTYMYELLIGDELKAVYVGGRYARDAYRYSELIERHGSLVQADGYVGSSAYLREDGRLRYKAGRRSLWFNVLRKYQRAPGFRLRCTIVDWYDLEVDPDVENALIESARALLGEHHSHRGGLVVNIAAGRHPGPEAGRRGGRASTAVKDENGRSVNAVKAGQAAAASLTVQQRRANARLAGVKGGRKGGLRGAATTHAKHPGIGVRAMSAANRARREADPRRFRPARPGSRMSAVAALLLDRFPASVTLAEFMEHTNAEREGQVRAALDHLLGNGYHHAPTARQTWALLPSCPSLQRPAGRVAVRTCTPEGEPNGHVKPE